MTQAAALAQQGSTGVSPGFRNRIINGAMVINQRGFNGAGGTNGTYTLDRWCVQNNSGASRYTVSQNAGSVTPPAGFVNYLGLTSSGSYSVTSTDVIGIYQQIEGYNAADLNWGSANAKTVTVSFWVRSSITGTYSCTLLEGNTGTVSYPATYSVSSANTWEYKTITIAGPTTGTFQTTNLSAIQVLFNLGNGSTYLGTANTWNTGAYFAATGQTNWVGTNGATFYITGVQLEVGSTATSFDYRPYGTEFDLCRRYYERFTNSGFYCVGGAMYANQPRFILPCYTKRAAATFGSSAGSTFYVQANGTNQTPTGFSVAGTDTTNAYFYATGTTLSVGMSAALANSASSYIDLSAEL